MLCLEISQGLIPDAVSNHILWQGQWMLAKEMGSVLFTEYQEAISDVKKPYLFECF